ncbi:MAG: toxin-antitoxin system protein [Lachnospiraceae bacterium]|nr:toxin-antitoxin system protein [Lachnospiraceae bacterium]
MSDRPLKEKVSITLDSNIVADVRQLAENDDRSFSQYINMVLKYWITLNRKKIEKEQ